VTEYEVHLTQIWTWSPM